MESKHRPKYILVIDRQEYWRNLSGNALAKAGFNIRIVDSYEYPPVADESDTLEPDLVLLGCASIGLDEHELIGSVLEHGHHLLVLSSSLQWKVMRALFLVGASDVVNKPYDPTYLVELVQQALENTATSDQSRKTENGGAL